MAESDFSELLHAAEQLSAEVEGSGDLPKVERTLRQVLEASTELWSRVTQAGAQDTQAYVFPVMVTASVNGVPYEPGLVEFQYIMSYKPDPHFISNFLRLMHYILCVLPGDVVFMYCMYFRQMRQVLEKKLIIN